MDEPKFLSQHNIAVRKIKLVSLFLDEFNIAEDELFKIDFNRAFSVDLEQGLVIINLDVTYSVPKNENERRTVLNCVVHNVFGIENLKEFLDDKGSVKLPIETLAILVGLCITHTRAVIAINTAGTALGDTLLPIVNPIEAAKALFDEAEY